MTSACKTRKTKHTLKINQEDGSRTERSEKMGSEDADGHPRDRSDRELYEEVDEDELVHRRQVRRLRQRRRDDVQQRRRREEHGDGDVVTLGERVHVALRREDGLRRVFGRVGEGLDVDREEERREAEDRAEEDGQRDLPEVVRPAAHDVQGDRAL